MQNRAGTIVNDASGFVTYHFNCDDSDSEALITVDPEEEAAFGSVFSETDEQNYKLVVSAQFGHVWMVVRNQIRKMEEDTKAEVFYKS